MAVDVVRRDVVCEFERVAASDDAGDSGGQDGARGGEAAKLVSVAGLIWIFDGVRVPVRIRVGGTAIRIG